MVKLKVCRLWEEHPPKLPKIRAVTHPKGWSLNSCSDLASRPQEWLAKASLCSPEPFPGAWTLNSYLMSPAPGALANQEIHPGIARLPLWSNVLPSWASSDTNGRDLVSFEIVGVLWGPHDGRIKRRKMCFLLSLRGYNREEQKIMLLDWMLFHKGDIPEIHTLSSGKCVSAWI